MADLTAVVLESPYEQAPDPVGAGEDIFTEAKTLLPTGRDFLLLESAAGDTVTIASVEDPQKRLGDVSIVLAAGERSIYGPVQATGFADGSTGLVSISAASDATCVLFRTK